QSPGVHQITVSGIDPFDVLCDNQSDELGWIVIQHRSDAEEDFNRDWATYREGFGSFDGDFFLGLEKIYRLTSSRPHELLVRYFGFDYPPEDIRYDDFKISDESTGYALSLGEFEGRMDLLRDSDKMKFSTFDRDNCRGSANWAELSGCGWWYENWNTP
ncbi:hypothetical protein KR093_010679, partial [Drosophila rubida]